MLATRKIKFPHHTVCKNHPFQMNCSHRKFKPSKLRDNKDEHFCNFRKWKILASGQKALIIKENVINFAHKYENTGHKMTKD